MAGIMRKFILSSMLVLFIASFSVSAQDNPTGNITSGTEISAIQSSDIGFGMVGFTKTMGKSTI